MFMQTNLEEEKRRLYVKGEPEIFQRANTDGFVDK
jgi:hypothetical protein